MTSLLSGRHKYLTNKNTKKGQKVRKIIALSALKNGYYRVQILSKAVFLKWYLFFCTLYPQTSWLRKSEETREKPPKSWDFGGSKPWYLFWLHDMYRAAEKDISRKSLRYKGFRRFLMHFSLLLRDLNKTTGILLSAKKDITLFSRQFAKPRYYGGQKVELVHTVTHHVPWKIKGRALLMQNTRKELTANISSTIHITSGIFSIIVPHSVRRPIY